MTVVHSDMDTHAQFLKFTIGLGLGFRFAFFCHFVLVAFVALDCFFRYLGTKLAGKNVAK